MEKSTIAIAVTSACLFGASCATTPPETSRTVRFACDGGPPITVIFEGNSATVTPEGGEPVTLPQAPSGSGFLYMTPQHSLRGKGDEVTWTIGRMVPMQCKVE